MSVHATSPLSAVTPRHRRPDAEDPACPPWCDPRRCVTSRHGGIHVGTPTYWHSTVADVEFGLARYQDVGEPEAFLLTLRRVATAGPIEVTVSRTDLQRFVDTAERLCSADNAGSEVTGDDAPTG